MPKRKRDSTSPPPSRTKDRFLSTRISNLQTIITQGSTALKKAFTLARGFERQKLGRRQKAANNEPKTLLKLREEVIVLKQLDLTVVAERQLLKRLGRVKRVSESEAFTNLYGGREWGVVGEAEGNVVARLMGSHPVKEVLPGVVERVLGVLELQGEGGGKRGKDQSLQDGGVKATRMQGNELMRAEGDEWSGSESEGEDEMSLDGETGPANGNGIGSGSMAKAEANGSDVDMDGDSEFSGFSAKIGVSSDDNSEAASSNSDSDISNDKTGTRSIKPKARTPLKLNISPSPFSSPEPTKIPIPKPTKKSKPKPPNLSSTAFLPSLMMGGYYSGSESASDIEDSLNSNKARKNRRGQRARQKIAEAKFGAAAKHIGKEKQTRDGGWDAKRGATDGDRNGRFNARGRMRIDGGRPVDGNGISRGPTGSNGDALGSSGMSNEVAKDKERPMHPSWEAARKRKEQGSKISIDTGKGGGVGRKIVFD